MKRKASSSSRTKRTWKRRRTTRTKRTASRRRAGQVSVKRTVYGGQWTMGFAATSDFWKYMIFDMSNFNNFSEMAAVFDEYKVNAIKVTYRPAYDSVSNLSAAGAVVQPQAYAHVVVDPASTTNPSGTYGTTSLQTFLEQERVKTYTLNRPFSIYFKPKVLDQVYNTGTASVVRSSPWVRTSDTACVYRGYHMYLQQNNFSSGNSNVKLDYYITMYCQFRNLK